MANERAEKKAHKISNSRADRGHDADTNRALPAIFQSGNCLSRVIPCAARRALTVERVGSAIMT